ncbi:MAG: STAS domain-containing protein [Planctomycetaceae bacterium]|nr:STAS domain-containing protein [Planctomycetaceae bacterium]
MREVSPRLSVTKEGNVTVVVLTDRKILDEVNIMQIGEQLSALAVGQGTPHMVLDFANVAHMSSSALGVLITLNKRIRERKGDLRLCNIQPAIYEIFVITRLNEIFQICSSRQEAVDSLAS